MPFYPDIKKKSGDPQGMTLSGQGSVFDDAGQQQQPGAKDPTAPTESGQFTPIQKYIEANKGGQVKEQLVNPLGQRWDTAKQGLNGVEDQFKGQVNAQATRPNEELLKGAALDPTKTVQDPEKKAAVLGQGAAQYKGPTALSQYEAGNKAVTGAEKADQEVEQSKSEAGRMNLIDSTYRRPTTTHGETLLDQLLMQNDPEARNQLTSFQGQYDSLDKDAGAIRTNAGAYGKAAVDDAAKSRQLYKSTIVDPYTQQADQLNTDYGALIQGKHSLGDRAQQELASGSLSPDLMAMLGLSTDTDTYGFDMSQFMDQAPDPTRTQSLKGGRSEAERINAFGQLAGSNPLYDMGASDYGTYDPNKPISFNQDRYGQAVQGAKDAYGADMSGTNLTGYNMSLAEAQQGLDDQERQARDNSFETGNARLSYTDQALAEIAGMKTKHKFGTKLRSK